MDFQYPFMPKDKLDDFLVSLSRSGYPLFEKVGAFIKPGMISDEDNQILQKCALWYLVSDTPAIRTEGPKIEHEITLMMQRNPD
jgi:hypothetical protein